MDKKLKQLIADNKLSDEQLIALIENIMPAAQSGGSKQTEDSEQKDESENPSNREAFTEKELDEWIEKKVAEKLSKMPKNQDININPIIDNPNKPPQYKILKMK